MSAKKKLNKGQAMLALSEACDALAIAQEQIERAARQLVALSEGEAETAFYAKSAIRLLAGKSKFLSPLKHNIQRDHDELCHQFTQDWRA